MTAESFYRRSAFLPIALPVMAAAVATLTGLVPLAPTVRASVVDVAGFLAIAGVVGLLPYATWAVVAVAWAEPSTEADYRRLSWFAPASIALPVGVLMALFAGSRSLSGLVGSAGAWGLLALCVGYFYAVLVNAGLVVAKRVGCVANQGQTAASRE